MTNDKNDSMYDTMKTLMMQSDMLRSVGNKHKAIGDNNSGYDDDPFDGNGRPNYSAINFNNFDWDGNYVGRFGGNDDNEEGGGGDDNQDEERK